MKLILVCTVFSLSSLWALSTDDRIRIHGYPVEKHEVQTLDGYVLTMFRIPHSPNSKSTSTRPVAFLEHGLFLSSDCWILNGPASDLAYMLSDAGYDVWLGNNRGNTYSRKHVQLSPLLQRFWNYEWHQIALYDVTAMIDYALFETNQRSLHYVGHSQGTTVFLVMTSMVPRYNHKIKSAHLLAPIAFMGFRRIKLLTGILPSLGHNGLVELFGSLEMFPNNKIISAFGTEACKADAITHDFCLNILRSIFRVGSNGLNSTFIPDIIDTFPAGASINQVIHYKQEYVSGKFRQFDYGMLRNVLTYGRISPPDYNLKNVNAPTFIYYSDNDIFANTPDVDRLIEGLSNVQYKFRVPDPNWGHVDFLWAYNVKDMIYVKVVENINKMEYQSMV